MEITLLEQFSIECQKAKTKVITTANQNKGKYSTEPIRTWIIMISSSNLHSMMVTKSEPAEHLDISKDQMLCS